MLFSNYSAFLNAINTYLWIATVCAPLTMYLLNYGSKSYFIGAIVWCVSHFINLNIEKPLWDFTSQHGMIYWFSVYATIDAICLTLIYVLHKKSSIKVGFTSLSIALCFSALAIIQVARYIDGMVIGTNVLGFIYKTAINTGNLVCTVVLTVPVIMAMYFNLRSVTVGK